MKSEFTLTQDEIKKLRENSCMHAFTFNLDDVTKYLVLKRLRENNLDAAKGSISALIRVLLRYFTELIDDDPTFKYFIAEIEKEYLFTTKKNKRSTM